MRIPYGIAETKGFRRSMEDSHGIWDDPPAPFGAEVFDGHGGSNAAVLAAEVLTPYFFHGRRIRGAKDTGQQFRAEDLREAYLATDRYILSQGTESGTAAATLYLDRASFLAANVGDVRIVLGNGNGFQELTCDHKPDVPEETSRIEALGGRVVRLDVARVQGMLSMSRALGDRELKPFVSPEPRIAEGFLGRANDIAVIACDGLWDVVTSKEAVTIARAQRDAEEAAERLIATAQERGSMDNVTVIVLDLKSYTTSCERENVQIVRVLDRAVNP